MQTMFRLNIAIVLFIGLLGMSHTNAVFACSPQAGPIATTTPQQFFDNATHVFSGKVLSVERDNKFGTGPYSYYIATSTFEVSMYWKGDVKKYIQVATINNPAGCQIPYSFVVGQEYLVYAYYNSYNNMLVTNDSGWEGPGTQPLKDAGTHLVVLKQGSTPRPIVNPFPPQPPVSSYTFLRDLQLGNNGEDVKNLQKYLNSRGFVVSTSGAGSPGNETDYFGSLTKTALIKFQNSYLSQLGISQGTGYFGPLTKNLIQTLRN